MNSLRMRAITARANRKPGGAGALPTGEPSPQPPSYMASSSACSASATRASCLSAHTRADTSRCGPRQGGGDVLEQKMDQRISV
jgi:hypothetical protein